MKQLEAANTVHNSTRQDRTGQSSTRQDRTKHNITGQNRTLQHGAEQVKLSLVPIGKLYKRNLDDYIKTQFNAKQNIASIPEGFIYTSIA